MIVRITDLKLPLGSPTHYLGDEVARRLNLTADDFGPIRIRRRALDARRASYLQYVYTVEVDTPLTERAIASIAGVEPVRADSVAPVVPGSHEMRGQPVIVGAGPAGLFAAWRLSEYGYQPILLERGKPVEDRRYDTAAFWKNGTLDPDSNVLFGEGGAGAFSDGKLTSRIKDARREEVLGILAMCGAPENIVYDARPHVGTNRLPYILRELRTRLLAQGTEIRFGTRMTDLGDTNGMRYVDTNHYRIDSGVVVLAIGHSARDTYAMLAKRNIALEPKPFAMGIRVQHSQELIDRAQYGRAAGTQGLEAGEYVLTCARTNVGRAVYSFCMCPGGTVIPCASEPGTLCCNGMSGEHRSGPYANGAIVAEVSTRDFADDTPLGGIELQRVWERKAFEATGGTYALPVMALDDFVRGEFRKRSRDELALRRFPRAEFVDLHQLLPETTTAAIRQASKQFNRQIRGWIGSGGVAFGIETRTSAPVRILRNETGESISTPGLFPAGEGAGYAGGIISAAVDGLRAAEAVIKKYARSHAS
ncbi:MAG TPA: hypothetical protein ENN56_03510 [Firmicutes bacterium]|nr:hypothetical protein [Bacillota bacterium]